MYALLLLSHTAHNITELEGQTPQAVIMGNTCDISKLVQFEWFQWVWISLDTYQLPKRLRTVTEKKGKVYYDHEHGLDQDLDMELGRYLGPRFEVATKILTKVRMVAVRTWVVPVTQKEFDSEDHKRLQDGWNEALKERLTERFNPMTADEYDQLYQFAVDFHLVNDGELVEDESPMPEADDIDHSTFDKYLHMQVLM